LNPLPADDGDNRQAGFFDHTPPTRSVGILQPAREFNGRIPRSQDIDKHENVVEFGPE
jgi:hypothetical protein